MIDAECFTNIDEYKREEWPKKFAAVPRKGERVQSADRRSLVVVAVTHCCKRDGSPYIRVELHRGP